MCCVCHALVHCISVSKYVFHERSVPKCQAFSSCVIPLAKNDSSHASALERQIELYTPESSSAVGTRGKVQRDDQRFLKVY